MEDPSNIEVQNTNGANWKAWTRKSASKMNENSSDEKGKK